MHCTALLCISVYITALHWPALYWPALQFTALHRISLIFTELNCTVHHYKLKALNCIVNTVLMINALHFTVLDCTLLYFTK